MKAKDLAKLLLQTPYKEILIYDADAEEWMPVTGLVTGPDFLFTDGTIKLYSDVEP